MLYISPSCFIHLAGDFCLCGWPSFTLICLDHNCAAGKVHLFCIHAVMCKALGWAGLLGFLTMQGKGSERPLARFSVPGKLRMVHLQVKANSVKSSDVTRRKYTLTHFSCKHDYFFPLHLFFFFSASSLGKSVVIINGTWFMLFNYVCLVMKDDCIVHAINLPFI